MSDPMPFRFGAAVSEPESPKEWGELARRVEDLGYSTLLLADHIVNPWAPLPALVAAAAATTTLRVVQDPHPPIMIGGGGPQVLRLAAREASIISVAPQVRGSGAVPESLTSSGVSDRIQWVREAAGDRFDNLEFGTYYSGRAEIKEDARSWLTTRAEERIQQGNPLPWTVDEVLESPMALYGTSDELVERIVLNRERYRFNYLVFHDDQVEAFAPIVEQLSGT